MKLGKVTPKVWEDLEQKGLSEEDMEDAAAEAAAAAAAAQEEEEQEELGRLKNAEMAREALNRVRGRVRRRSIGTEDGKGDFD